MKRIALLALSFALAALDPGAAVAQQSEIRIAKQYGLGYLQLIVAEDRQLVEKHAKAQGLGDVKVTWATFRSSDVMNDALLSDSVDFVCLGIPGFVAAGQDQRRPVLPERIHQPEGRPRVVDASAGFRRRRRRRRHVGDLAGLRGRSKPVPNEPTASPEDRQCAPRRGQAIAASAPCARPAEGPVACLATDLPVPICQLSGAATGCGQLSRPGRCFFDN